MSGTQANDPDGDDEAAELDDGGEDVLVVLTTGDAGGRLDKALAEHAPSLSRARVQALMAQGAVTRDGVPVSDPSARAQADVAYTIRVPAPAAAEPQPEAIPLTILFEDANLIVIDKAAGMAVHPAPGSVAGTLVNALLHHCAGTLSGIGGVLRPGIVHRLDKDTSGVMVAAKSDAAHQGLAALFARHDVERVYLALTRGAPEPSRGTVATRIARSRYDRKKMAVVKSGGREAVTHYRVERSYGPALRPFAARVACRLETGRTHQIRVHLASKGAPCLADPIYGSGAPASAVRRAIDTAGIARQALHASVLGFVHPISGERLRFESPLPADMAALEAQLRAAAEQPS